MKESIYIVRLIRENGLELSVEQLTDLISNGHPNNCKIQLVQIKDVDPREEG